LYKTAHVGSVMVHLALSSVRGSHFYMIPHSLAITFLYFLFWGRLWGP
jgi:hypothetical protein